MKLRLCLLVVFVCTLSASACSGSEKPTYLALGDSFGIGAGASNSGNGYVPLLFSFLEKDTKKDVSLRNLAVSGETTASMIAGGQLGKALAELRFRNQDNDHKNDVFVITIDIGINDLNALTAAGQPCAPPIDTRSAACAAATTSVMNETAQNLTSILHSLRVAAGPDAKMLIVNCFNSYSGTGKPLDATEDALLPLLNEKISQVAALSDVDAKVADAFDAFDGKGAELTSVSGPTGDFHPNDAGHRVIADLLIAAYNEQ